MWQPSRAQWLVIWPTVLIVLTVWVGVPLVCTGYRQVDACYLYAESPYRLQLAALALGALAVWMLQARRS